MLDHDAAVVVDDGQQLTQFVRRCLNSPTTPPRSASAPKRSCQRNWERPSAR